MPPLQRKAAAKSPEGRTVIPPLFVPYNGKKQRSGDYGVRRQPPAGGGGPPHSAGGAGCSPACWGDDGGCGRPGGGSGPGGAAGAGRRGAVRPVSHPAGAGAPPPAGPGAGPAVLADAHRDPVPLVPVGLGRAGAPVRGGVSVPGRGGLLRAVQPLAALAGVPAGRPDYSNS